MGTGTGTTAGLSAHREEPQARRINFFSVVARFVCVNSICNNEAQQSPLLWLGSEPKPEVLRTEPPSGHLPGVRRWDEEDFGPGATSVASIWGHVLGTSAA